MITHTTLSLTHSPYLHYTALYFIQSYVDAAVKSFERSSGWYLWNWKVQPGIGFDEWDVQGQHLKRGGLDPFKAIRDLDEENLNYIIKNERGKKPAASGDNVPGN